jgi:hypothetical protein
MKWTSHVSFATIFKTTQQTVHNNRKLTAYVGNIIYGIS